MVLNLEECLKGFQNSPCWDGLASSYPSLTMCPVKKVYFRIQLRYFATHRLCVHCLTISVQYWFLILPGFPRVLQIFFSDLDSWSDLFCFMWNILDYALIHFCVLVFLSDVSRKKQESRLSFPIKLFWFQEYRLNIFPLVSILHCDQLCIFPGCLK